MFANRRSIAEALEHLKKNLAPLIESEVLERICRESGLRWRERLFTPATTLHCMILQMLHGNAAISQIRWLTQIQFSAGAYCKARMRVPVQVLHAVLLHTAGPTAAGEERESRWFGHRVFVVDGSSMTLPDAPQLAQHYGYPPNQKQGCGFPAAQFLALLHLGTGRIAEVVDNPWARHDSHRLDAVHAQLQKDDILLGDRAFSSFAHWSALRLREVHGVIRKVARPYQWRDLQQLFDTPAWTKPTTVSSDEIVEYANHVSTRPYWMSESEYSALPQKLSVREVVYKVQRKGYRAHTVVLQTSLLDKHRYPATRLAQLYFQRWRIEVTFADLKTSMGMEQLRCQTIDGVRRELLAFVIAYNLVQRLLLGCARTQRVSPNKLSFIDALRCLRSAGTRHNLPLLIKPIRSGRTEPRAVKRRPKPYPLLTKPRHLLTLQLLAA